MNESAPLIGLVTCEAARPLDEDHAPLAAALERAGCRVEAPAWDDPAVDWSRYSLALLRATWNYMDRLEAFLRWAKQTAAATQLRNPHEIVQWNTDKRYLAELEEQGVAIIPSTFAAPGEDIVIPDAPEVVVKPSVGGGSRGARRFRASDGAAMREHAASLQAAGLTALVQPYLKDVDANGETALMYFDGEFSHAIRKGPLLGLDGSDVSGLFAPEDIRPRAAAPDERELAERAIAAIPGGAPLYARVDVVRDARGTPRVLELELTEPSLFFAHAAGSADRFAAAIRRAWRKSAVAPSST
jgi:O-ureido-D-serine cyclo-ligase